MPINRPKARTESYLEVPEPRAQEQPIVVSGPNVAGGMNTFLDSSNLDESMFTSLQNVNIRTGRLSRRYGSSLLTPTKPNSNTVLNIWASSLYNLNVVQYRFTKTDIYARSTLTWDQIVPHAGAPVPIGGSYDRWRTVTIDDKIYTTNNGINPLYTIDPVNDYLLSTGDAPSFKYIATMANRVIGAYLTKPYGGGAVNPNWLGWSGDTNFTEWDPTVDVSAGFVILLDTIVSHEDFITGLLGFESKLLVMREESIVIGTILQSATNPFYFYIAVPNIGCSAPDTLVSTANGCIWYDHKTRMVYDYLITGSEPSKIGLPVAETIANSIVDPTQIFGSWDSLREEYQLCVPIGGLTKIWTYSRRTQTWWFNVISNVTAITSAQYVASAVTIGSLAGTIGDQVGTIGDFGSGVLGTSRMYGLSNGDILNSDTAQTQDAGQAYTTVIQSKNFENTQINAYWKQLRLEFNVAVVSTIAIYFSKDNGATWTLYKSVTLQPGNVRYIITCNKNVLSRQIMFQIQSNSGQWDLLRYEYSATPGAISRGSST